LRIIGNSNSVSDSKSNPLNLFDVLKEINARISKPQTSESNSAPINPPDANKSESDESSSLKKADEKE